MLRVKCMVAMVCSLAISSSALGQCCETVVFAEPETMVSEVWYSEPVVTENVVWPVSDETIVETTFVETVAWAERVFDDAVPINETMFWNGCECGFPVNVATESIVAVDTFDRGTVMPEQVVAADDSYTVARPVINSPAELLPSSDEEVTETTAKVDLNQVTDIVDDDDTDDLFSAPRDLE